MVKRMAEISDNYCDVADDLNKEEVEIKLLELKRLCRIVVRG